MPAFSRPSARLLRVLPALVLLLSAAACDSTDSMDDDDTTAELSAAYAEFDSDNVTVMLDGNQVLIESNGMPNHTSPYWSNTTERSAVDPMGNTLATRSGNWKAPSRSSLAS